MSTSMRVRSTPQEPDEPADQHRPRNRKRRWGFVLGAVVLMGGSVLGNLTLVHGIHDREPVLVLARDVPWGQPITEEAVTTVDVPPDSGVVAVPESRRGQIVGQTATGPLTAGSLLTDRDISRQEIPGPGQRLVGIRVEPGQLPGKGLSPNDPVAITPVPDTGSTSTTSEMGGDIAAAEPFRARVVRSGEPDADGAVVVDVLVAEPTSRSAVQAASQGAVLTLLGPDQQFGGGGQ